MENSVSNLLLAHLPAESRATLMRHLEPVVLPVDRVLYKSEQTPIYAHFLTAGMASVVTNMEDGDVVEVGLVGHEGNPECLHLLGPARVPTHCFMQVAGAGLRMKFSDFRRYFDEDPAIRSTILRFVQAQTLNLGQLAACNRVHEVEERLARWLLMVADRVNSSELKLTQEFLAQMLGTRRSTVTITAGGLQRAGFIDYTRGVVKIVDRAGLEDIACECYKVTTDALARLYDPSVATLNGAKLPS